MKAKKKKKQRIIGSNIFSGHDQLDWGFAINSLSAEQNISEKIIEVAHIWNFHF